MTIERSEPTKDKVKTLRYFLERYSLSNTQNTFEPITKAEYEKLVNLPAFTQYNREQKGRDVYLTFKERL